MKFSSRNLAAFYYQLGTLVQAGVPIQKALTSVQKAGPRPMRATVARLSSVVNEGVPLSDAMERHGARFAQLDKQAIDISGRSGALDVGFMSLSKYYESRASARNKLIAGCVYPAVLLTVAVFGAKFPAFFLGASGGKPYTTFDYLLDTVGLLAMVGLVFGGAIWLVRWSLRVPGLNVTVDRLLQAVPVLGRLRFDYALSQWISSIRLLLRAGVGIVPALEYASRMVQSPLIASGYQKAAPLIGGELEVSQALATTGVFPDDVIQFWATGEQSGQMDETLDRLAKFYEERWHRSLDQAATWLPRIAYGFVVLYTAYQIISMYGSYLGQYDELLK